MIRAESRRLKSILGCWIVLILLALVSPVRPSAAAEQAPVVVFLVRHAEKVDASRDPELSEAGKQRAEELARALRSAGVERIHSTDFIRTRDTAVPLAAKLGLEIEFYDHGNLEGLAESLRQEGGRHLVVGHSNTTPRVVLLLGGEPGSEIDEASEHDRLYVVTIGADHSVSTVLMRYGVPFVGD